MASMELLDLCIWSHSGGHYFLLLQHRQRLLNGWLSLGLRGVSLSLGFDSQSGHSSEKDFEHGLHIVYQHLLEVSLLLSEHVVLLLLPHFKYYTFVYVPVPHVLFKIL